MIIPCFHNPFILRSFAAFPGRPFRLLSHTASGVGSPSFRCKRLVLYTCSMNISKFASASAKNSYSLRYISSCFNAIPHNGASMYPECRPGTQRPSLPHRFPVWQHARSTNFDGREIAHISAQLTAQDTLDGLVQSSSDAPRVLAL